MSAHSPDQETPPIILLGITGSIAAYKSPELLRLFKKAGYDVQVLLTEDASQFVTASTLATLSGNPVLSSIFTDTSATTQSWTQHISLGLKASLFLIAPATAQTIAKLAHGFSDSMLTATALAARCPIMVCPAMDHDMYVHAATQSNIERLKSFGYDVMPPEHGELASGLIGEGRLPDLHAIFDRASTHLNPRKTLDLEGKKVLITAGPTREALDPVRFLSNPSTGTMGFALAAAAHRYGAEVTLIAGPSSLPTPPGVRRIDVVSANEMHQAVSRHKKADIVMMAAAVADYRPAQSEAQKIKKTDGNLTVEFVRNPDILKELGKEKSAGQILVGFALETDNKKENALRKLEQKNLDWIILNSPSKEGEGFGPTTNRVTLISRAGQMIALPLDDKKSLADTILVRLFA